MDSMPETQPYTSNTLSLLGSDILLFFQLSLTWPGLLSIVLPFSPTPSGDLDELSLTRQNLWAIFLHIILFVSQVIFITGVPLSCVFGLPFPIFVYTPVCLFLIVLYVLCNRLFCRLLNGSSGHLYFAAGREYAANGTESGDKWVSEKHEGERWIFLNGVAVGSHWLESNLERLAKTFRRPILGIHNATCGIPFDVLECIVQRTFTYPTLDIRVAYKKISSVLSDKRVTKLVLIAHSQGAIEAGMVLDWLYNNLPADQIRKLEVFTFGNASNHWNCPRDENGELLIKHMEHYVNRGDWVSRFGILHFRQAAGKSPPRTDPLEHAMKMHHAPPDKRQTWAEPDTVNRRSTWAMESEQGQKNRFFGRMFIRDGSGHQFNQHYLDNMFPLDQNLSKVVQEKAGEFMNGRINMKMLETDDTVELLKRDSSSANKWANVAESEGNFLTVKNQSRLWGYINGKKQDD